MIVQVFFLQRKVVYPGTDSNRHGLYIRGILSPQTYRLKVRIVSSNFVSIVPDYFLFIFLYYVGKVNL